MDIRTIKVTEIEVDKDTKVQLPSETRKAVDKGFPARLVFDTKTGEKSMDIELLAWHFAKNGKHTIIVKGRKKS